MKNCTECGIKAPIDELRKLKGQCLDCYIDIVNAQIDAEREDL